ncbi:MAG: hypothetical protein HWE30_18830 [Methylocystaceae bacterium]|nr:hypothetical protein [Methylocystaceae bacterium]
MTNTTTNRMKRLIADISEHGATPSRVKKITNALRAVTAERDTATARVAELERLVELADARCEICADPATTLDSAGDAACAACAAKDGGK